jgi:hypothetical protein
MKGEIERNSADQHIDPSNLNIDPKNLNIDP